MQLELYFLALVPDVHLGLLVCLNCLFRVFDVDSAILAPLLTSHLL